VEGQREEEWARHGEDLRRAQQLNEAGGHSEQVQRALSEEVGILRAPAKKLECQREAAREEVRALHEEVQPSLLPSDPAPQQAAALQRLRGEAAQRHLEPLGWQQDAFSAASGRAGDQWLEALRQQLRAVGQSQPPAASSALPTSSGPGVGRFLFSLLAAVLCLSALIALVLRHRS
jgi:hypothetical protein